MKTPSRLIILLAGLVLCTVCGVLYAWSIFVVPLEQAFGWQRPETSLTFTFMITFFSLGMFAGGKLLRFGPARAVQIGGALLCVGLLWASRIDSVIGLYLSYGVVSGFGIGIVNLVPAAVCLRWYPERKGLVSGLLTMALALGTLLFGTVGAGWLIGKVGVSSTFMALAVLFLGIIVLGSLFLRMPEAAPGKEEGDGVGLRDMLHTPSYWMIWGWMLTIQIGGLMIIGHIVPYALECGLTAAQAGLGMGVYAIANGVGRLFFGYVHDRFGRAWGMGLDAVFMGCGLVLLAVLPSRFGMAGFLIAAVPVALAFGGTIPQLAALIMAFFGPRHFGVNYGFSTSPLMVASVCGPFIGGLIRAWSGDYLVALYVAAAITLLGVARRLCSGKRPIRENRLHGRAALPPPPFLLRMVDGWKEVGGEGLRASKGRRQPQAEPHNTMYGINTIKETLCQCFSNVKSAKRRCSWATRRSCGARMKPGSTTRAAIPAPLPRK